MNNQYVNKINKISKKFSFNQEQEKILYLIAALPARGRITAQVPSIAIDENVPNLMVSDIILENEDYLELFDKGYLQWKCFSQKIFLSTRECKNPKTKRKILGFTYITKKTIQEFGDALYEIYNLNAQENIIKAKFIQKLEQDATTFNG